MDSSIAMFCDQIELWMNKGFGALPPFIGQCVRFDHYENLGLAQSKYAIGNVV